MTAGCFVFFIESCFYLKISAPEYYINAQIYEIFANVVFASIFAIAIRIRHGRTHFPTIVQLFSFLAAANVFIITAYYFAVGTHYFPLLSTASFVVFTGLLFFAWAAYRALSEAGLILGKRISPSSSSLIVCMLTAIVAFNAASLAIQWKSIYASRTAMKAGSGKAPNIVIILIDALRYDGIHCNGNERNTTPAIDSLMRQSVRFDLAFAQGNCTMPSVASIMTGLYPPQHTVYFTGNSMLPSEIETFPDSFGKYGYKTAAFSGNVVVSDKSGFARGFDYFHYVPSYRFYKKSFHGTLTAWARELFVWALHTDRKQYPLTDDGVLLNNALHWISDQNGRSPVLVYIHLISTHFPYAPLQYYDEMFGSKQVPGADYDSLFASVKKDFDEGKRISSSDKNVMKLMNLYDSRIRYVDDRIGEFIDGMRRIGMFDDSIIVICADHGEEFGDQGGIFHEKGFGNAVLHVPLAFRFPHGEGAKRIGQPVPLFSIFPTLADYVRAPAPENIPAKSLMPLINGTATSYPDPIFTITRIDDIIYETIISWPWKLKRESGKGRDMLHLYDIEKDFNETRDIASTEPSTVKRLSAELDRIVALPQKGKPSNVRMDRKTIEKMKQLGYFK